MDSNTNFEDMCYWLAFSVRPISFTENTDLIALKKEIETVIYQIHKLLIKNKWRVVIINGDTTIAVLHPNKNGFDRIVAKLGGIHKNVNIDIKYSIISDKIRGVEEITNAYVFQKLNQNTVGKLIESLIKK